MDNFPLWIRRLTAARDAPIRCGPHALLRTRQIRLNPREAKEPPVPAVLTRFLTLPWLFLSLSTGNASAMDLVTAKEAKLPDAVPRGITRSPTIRLVSPETDAKPAASPFIFKVSFEPHGGSHMEPQTIRVTYLKMPPVDLTKRLAPYISDTGIEVPDAETPAGMHSFRIVVNDSDGRTSETIVSLRVAR